MKSYQQPLWQDDNFTVLLPPYLSSERKSIIKRFLDWLEATGQHWMAPDLEAYEAFLNTESDLSPATIETEKSRIRVHYRKILADPRTLDHLPDDARRQAIDDILGRLGYDADQIRSFHLQIALPDSLESSENFAVLMPEHNSRRMQRFINWLNTTGRHWTQPEWTQYEQHLMQSDDLSTSKVKAHIFMIRERYRLLLQDDYLLSQLPGSERETFVSRIKAALKPRRIYKESRYIIREDPTNRPFWLTQPEGETLLHAPDTTTLTGLRNRAAIILALHAGLMQNEIRRLEVSDLIIAESTLHIRGERERHIPFEKMPLIQAWLDAAEIQSGPVIRSVRGTEIGVVIGRSVLHEVMLDYPIERDGRQIQPSFDDLRCTYARWLYEDGVALRRIQYYLGHRHLKSTVKFMGLRHEKNQGEPDSP